LAGNSHFAPAQISRDSAERLCHFTRNETHDGGDVAASAKFDRRISMLLAVIGLDALGAGLIVPVLPLLLQRIDPAGRFGAGVAYGALIAIYSVCLFFAGPMLARLSDSVGRRPIIILTLCGAAIDYLIMGCTWNYWILFAGRAIAGSCGANISTASAYIADILPEEERTAGFGLAGAMAGLGFIAGPILGAASQNAGLRAPFIVASVLSALTAVGTTMLLPESVASQNRRPLRLADANPLGPLIHVGKSAAVRPVLMGLLVYQCAVVIAQTVWVLYLARRFGAGAGEVGLSLTIFGILAAVVQGGLAGPIEKRLGSARTLGVAISGAMLGDLIFAFASSRSHVYAGMIVSSAGWMVVPIIQARVSANLPMDRQGEVQGALLGIWGLAMIVMPGPATWILDTQSGEAVFSLAALLLSFALLITTRPRRGFADIVRFRSQNPSM
jgi:DHA1 family tetracycline resistance protein-like MFS transporter